MPILEPEISIKSPDKAGAERILLDELTKGLDALPAGRKVMFKLTLPEVPDFYQPLIKDKRVVRVVALSGGYTRARGVRASRQKSRHDRELLARARRGPQAFDVRRRVRQSADRCDRRDLSGLDGEGLRGGGQVLLRLGLTVCVAGLARARAQGHSLSPENPVVFRRRSEDTEYGALNPRRRVPVLVDDDFVLAESAAIVEYIEDRWPQRPGAFRS